MALIRVDRVGFVLLMGAYAIAPAVAMNLFLPAIAEFSDALDVTLNTGQLSVSLMFLGLAFGTAILGPMADAFGRRKTLIGSQLAVAVAALLAAAAPSIEVLFTSIFVQGAAAGGGAVAARAILKDRFEGQELVQKMSIVFVMIFTAPVVFPNLAALILQDFNWHAVFLVTAAYGLLTVGAAAFFEESLSPDRRAPVRLGSLLNSYGAILRHRTSATLVIVNGLAFGCFGMFAATISVVVVQHYGLDPTTSGPLIALVSFGLIAGNVINMYELERYGERRLVTIGVAIAVVATTIGLAFTIVGYLPISIYALTMMIAFLGAGIMMPNINAKVADNHPDQAGVAMAVLYIGQTLAGAAMSSVMAFLHADQVWPVIAVMLAAMLVIALLLRLGCASRPVKVMLQECPEALGRSC